MFTTTLYLVLQRETSELYPGVVINVFQLTSNVTVWCIKTHVSAFADVFYYVFYGIAERGIVFDVLLYLLNGVDDG